MDWAKDSIYGDLARRLNGFQVDDFVREYAKAYLDADTETLKKLQELLLQREISNDDSPDSGEQDSLAGAPLTPRPHLNSGAVAPPDLHDHDD